MSWWQMFTVDWLFVTCHTEIAHWLSRFVLLFLILKFLNQIQVILLHWCCDSLHCLGYNLDTVLTLRAVWVLVEPRFLIGWRRSSSMSKNLFLLLRFWFWLIWAAALTSFRIKVSAVIRTLVIFVIIRIIIKLLNFQWRVRQLSWLNVVH